MSLNFQMSDLQYLDNDEWFQYANNINSYTDLGLVVGKMSKPLSPQVQEQTQDVPGMYGNIFNGNDYGELTFTIPATIMAFDHTSFNIIVENIRAMLTADSRNPGIEYPIIFGDRPNVKYYGHWAQVSDPTFLTPNDWQASIQLTFICSRPYGYLNQQDVELKYPDQSIMPSGNATTYPTYKVHLNQDIYGIGFVVNSSNGEYVATGYQQENGTEKSVDADNTDDEGNRIQDSEPLDTDEEPTLLSDWITNGNNNNNVTTFQIDGQVAGKMGENESGGICPAYENRKGEDNKEHQTLAYGYPQYHKGDYYYGPLAVHPQFDNPTDDWHLAVELYNQKSSESHTDDRAMGKCEIYLLDENGHRRGKIYIHDRLQGIAPTIGFELGTSSKDAVDIINDSDFRNSLGPRSIKGTQIRINRHPEWNNGSARATFTVTSLAAYKKLVKAQTKSKKRNVRKSLRSNKRTNAKRRRTHEVTSSIAKSRAKYGNGRHVHHHYKKGRKGR